MPAGVANKILAIVKTQVCFISIYYFLSQISQSMYVQEKNGEHLPVSFDADRVAAVDLAFLDGDMPAPANNNNNAGF